MKWAQGEQVLVQRHKLPAKVKFEPRPLTTQYGFPHAISARLWPRNSGYGRGRAGLAAPKTYPVCHGVAEDHVLNIAAVFACAESAWSHIHSHRECQTPPVPNHPVNAGHVRWLEGHWGHPGHYSMPPTPNHRPAPPVTQSLVETPVHTTHRPPCPKWHVKERFSQTTSDLQLCSWTRDTWCCRGTRKLHFVSTAGVPERAVQLPGDSEGEGKGRQAPTALPQG